MMTDYMDFSILTDTELDRLIIELIQAGPGKRTPATELMGKSASEEWKNRYPETISPSFYAYAMERGGFPACYAGPRKTVQLGLSNPLTQETTDEQAE